LNGVEVRDDHVAEVEAVVKHVMENVIALRVPLVVHIHHGKRWGQLASATEPPAIVTSSYFSEPSQRDE
jgi:hypothetical protein